MTDVNALAIAQKQPVSMQNLHSTCHNVSHISDFKIRSRSSDGNARKLITVSGLMLSLVAGGGRLVHRGCYGLLVMT
jgi:hypothetical protein